MIEEISWKIVFNSNVADYYMWTNIGEACEAAKKTGYKYFTWNGYVFSVETGSITHITVNDLK